MTDLEAQAITVGYGRQPVLDGLNLHLAQGQFTGIVGPNGCGKSTLLKVLARLMRPWSGRVLLDGQDITRLGARRIAQSLAVLPQHPTAPPQMTVHELVACGRHPHVPRFGIFSPQDRKIVAQAMTDCELHALADRGLGTLSGGQQQRAWMATALAQQPSVLLLDEPLASLDINHQLEAMELLAHLNQQRGLTVGLVLHDLNLAARFCSELVLMHDGAIIEQGSPDAVFESGALEHVFQVDARISRDPLTGRPTCQFYRKGPSVHGIAHGALA